MLQKIEAFIPDDTFYDCKEISRQDKEKSDKGHAEGGQNRPQKNRNYNKCGNNAEYEIGNFIGLKSSPPVHWVLFS